jgi:hypothetical protein
MKKKQTTLPKAQAQRSGAGKGPVNHQSILVKRQVQNPGGLNCMDIRLARLPTALLLDSGECIPRESDSPFCHECDGL